MYTIAAPADTADKLVLPKQTGQPQIILLGYSCAETAATAATAEAIIIHGMDGTGEQIAPPINFSADGFDIKFFPRPIAVPNGLYLDRISGNTTFVFYVDKE